MYQSNMASFTERMNERTKPCKPNKGSVFVLKNGRLVMFQPNVDITYRWGHPYWKEYDVRLRLVRGTKFEVISYD